MALAVLSRPKSFIAVLLQQSQVVPSIPTTTTSPGASPNQAAHPSQGCLACLAHVAFSMLWCCCLRLPFKVSCGPQQRCGHASAFAGNTCTITAFQHCATAAIPSQLAVCLSVSGSLEGGGTVVPEGCAQGHPKMLKTTLKKAQQYHLLFRTRNSGQRRGPQQRAHHKACVHGCSCLHWSVFHHLSRERFGKG